MKRHLIYIIVLALMQALLLPSAFAETKEQRAESPHELRIGVGDPALARMGQWHKPTTPGAEYWWQTFGQPAPDAHAILTDGRYTYPCSRMFLAGHFFLEYQYRINAYIGVGMHVDMLTQWQRYIIYNGYQDRMGHGIYGLVQMAFVPRARFTFLHKQYVNLYASAGVGFAMDCRYDGTNPEYAAQIEATLFGLSIGENRFFGSIEVFNLAFAAPTLYFFPPQFLTASIGYRF